MTGGSLNRFSLFLWDLLRMDYLYLKAQTASCIRDGVKLSLKLQQKSRFFQGHYCRGLWSSHLSTLEYHCCIMDDDERNTQSSCPSSPDPSTVDGVSRGGEHPLRGKVVSLHKFEGPPKSSLASPSDLLGWIEGLPPDVLTGLSPSGRNVVATGELVKVVSMESSGMEFLILPSYLLLGIAMLTSS